MTWLTWRQQRLESLIGGVIFGLVAILLFLTGRSMISTYDHGGSAACVASHASDDACWSITSTFQDQFSHLNNLAPWLNFLPLFIGLLLAAPFVLELEQGTHRLAWTQSITRRRWLTTKLGWMVGVAIAVSLGLSLLWSWWHGPFDQLQGRFDASAFDFEGIVPIAYTLFALALCLAIGTIFRRTIPAVVVTIAVFLGLRVGIESKLRAHYMAPLQIVWDPQNPTPVAAYTRMGDGNWILGSDFTLKPGQTLANPQQALQTCIGTGNAKGVSATCLHAAGILNSIVYQPANRFWIFQGIEGAIFVGLATVLLALTIWWVLHRVT